MQTDKDLLIMSNNAAIKMMQKLIQLKTILIPSIKEAIDLKNNIEILNTDSKYLYELSKEHKALLKAGEILGVSEDE